MCSVENGFTVAPASVGAPVPLGTGLAFANKYPGQRPRRLTYFAMAASNQGKSMKLQHGKFGTCP